VKRAESLSKNLTRKDSSVSALKLKICGMREPENIRQVAALQPDYMGFIFYEKSPRFVGHNFSVPYLEAGVKRVGVFVNHSLSSVTECVANMKLDFVQLHGDESPSFCAALKDENIKVIKVFRVDDDFDFSVTNEYESVSDYFLFDTKGKLYGGNAVAFNWNVLEKYNQRVPFFLSGGIQSTNLKDLNKLNGLNVHAIDINSSVEDRPGLKNIEKIREIINQLSV
jgi:phosphoribosylanthranilate isomerase